MLINDRCVYMNSIFNLLDFASKFAIHNTSNMSNKSYSCCSQNSRKPRLSPFNSILMKSILRYKFYVIDDMYALRSSAVCAFDSCKL